MTRVKCVEYCLCLSHVIKKAAMRMLRMIFDMFILRLAYLCCDSWAGWHCFATVLRSLSSVFETGLLMVPPPIGLGSPVHQILLIAPSGQVGISLEKLTRQGRLLSQLRRKAIPQSIVSYRCFGTAPFGANLKVTFSPHLSKCPGGAHAFAKPLLND